MHTVETLRALPETIRLRLAAASHGSAHLAATGMRCVQLAAAEPDSRDLLDLGQAHGIPILDASTAAGRIPRL